MWPVLFRFHNGNNHTMLLLFMKRGADSSQTLYLQKNKRIISARHSCARR
jgi:hypothetical protein